MRESYAGVGTLTIDGEDHPCRYELNIYQSGRMKDGSGEIAAAADVLWAGFNSDRCQLTLDNGRSCLVILTGGFAGGSMPFKLGGALSHPDA